MKKDDFKGYGVDVGTVVETSATPEEMLKGLEEFRQKALENFGTVAETAPVHPLFFRDGLILSGYSKEKANEIVLKQAKEQGFTKDDLANLKNNLDK